MSNPETPRHIEIKDEDDRVVAAAEVTTARGPEGTVRTSLYAKSENVRPGDRAALVDTVMDLPEVQASDRVEASVPYGDTESLERLRQRTDEPETRVAGATALLDANVPSPARPAGQRRPDDELVGDEAAAEADEAAGRHRPADQ